MRKAPSIVAACVTVALAGTGCPIWLEGEHGGGMCVGEFCPCGSHTDCDPGYYCDPGYGECLRATPCPCPDGFTCDWRSTCVPTEVVSCDEDSDCTGGYCDLDSGVCVSTGSCRPGIEGDCDPYGESFVCDDRGVCVPDRGPCPTGECGCTSDSQCSGGWLCRSGRCRDPAEICSVTSECPGGTACVDSFCHVVGCPGVECPATQVCNAGTCEDDPDGGGQCVYSTECSANQLCVNGYCVQACTDSVSCRPFESCLSGLCLPEMRRNAY